MTTTKQQYHYGVGRRKESVATARVYPGSTAAVTVNGKELEEYFIHPKLQEKAIAPLMLLEKQGQYHVSLKVKGGGLNGQAEAALLALANALVAMDVELRSTLKRAGYIKRDPRIKERKKYGLKRARKAPQFTKR